MAHPRAADFSFRYIDITIIITGINPFLPKWGPSLQLLGGPLWLQKMKVHIRSLKSSLSGAWPGFFCRVNFFFTWCFDKTEQMTQANFIFEECRKVGFERMKTFVFPWRYFSLPILSTNLNLWLVCSNFSNRKSLPQEVYQSKSKERGFLNDFRYRKDEQIYT